MLRYAGAKSAHSDIRHPVWFAPGDLGILSVLGRESTPSEPSNSPRWARWAPRLPVVDELQGSVDVVGLLEQTDHRLQVIALLGGDPHLITGDLGLDALGSLIADQLGDLLRVLPREPFLERNHQAVLLAGSLRLLLPGVDRLERNPPPDQFGLEYIQDRQHPLLAIGADHHGI